MLEPTEQEQAGTAFKDKDICLFDKGKQIPQVSLAVAIHPAHTHTIQEWQQQCHGVPGSKIDVGVEIFPQGNNAVMILTDACAVDPIIVPQM